MNSIRSWSLRPVMAALSIGSAGLVIPALTCAGPIEITSLAIGFSNSATLTDFETAGATTAANTGFGTSALPQFNSSNGVLMGATINLDSSRGQTVLVTSTDGPNNGTNSSVTTTGVGSSTARLQAPGVDNAFSSITASGSCTGSRLGACSNNATAPTSPTALNAAVASANLNDYVGTGSVTVTRSAPTMSADQSLNKFTGVESTQYTVDWFGDLSATYAYLLHAAPSFDASDAALVLNLNLGNVFLNDVSSMNFDLFNLTGNRVGLDLDSIGAISGDTSKFLSNLAPFTGLGAGESNSFWISLVTTDVGAFAASYALTFSDGDVGATSSRWDNLQMTLNVNGSVSERLAPTTSAVPEPTTLALFGLGLAGIGFSRRRKFG